MALGRIKTEHAGPKHGRGFWGRKGEAKLVSSRVRRRNDRVVEDSTDGEDAYAPSPRSD